MLGMQLPLARHVHQLAHADARQRANQRYQLAAEEAARIVRSQAGDGEVRLLVAKDDTLDGSGNGRHGVVVELIRDRWHQTSALYHLEAGGLTGHALPAIPSRVG